jgi:ankyrin repeat protein
MKRNFSLSQKVALNLVSITLLSAAARADVQYTDVMSTIRDSKMTPMTTTTTWLKEGLQRIDTRTDMGQFRTAETTITNVPRRERISLDPELKIYVVESLNGTKGTASSTQGGVKAAGSKTTAPRKKGKLTMTMGVQFLGTVKMLNLNARHYTTSMHMDMSGECGTTKHKMKSEVWMADVKLPVLDIPATDNGGMGYGGSQNDGCDMTMENKGDVKGYQAAQKGLALKSIYFDEAGKPASQREITMLSFAALKTSEFSAPTGFKKVTREEYDKARQDAMMSAFSSGNRNDESSTRNEEADDDFTPATTKKNVVKTREVAPVASTIEAPAAPRYAPVALKNDAKLDKNLLQAVKDNNFEQAIGLLQNGANPNTADKGGMTPLMLASQNGKTEMVQALLDMGANANAVNKKGQTALHLATMIGAPQPKKKKFGGLGGLLGGAVAGDILGGGMGDLGGAGSWASSLLGSGGIDNLLGNNLSGLLNGGAFNLSGKSGWMAIIGTALQGDLKSNGAYGLQNLLSGGGKLDAQGWIGLVGAVKGSNANVLNAMSNIGGAQNGQWSQFVNAAASGDAKSVTSLMGDSKMKPLLDQALQGFSAASGELPANAAKNIVQSLVQKGANAAQLDGDGKTAAQLAQARNWNDVAALLQR